MANTQPDLLPAPPLGASTRRQQLGEFLRIRRTRLAPEAVGLAARARRRTPGLRREEVADLAEVGLSWYTWLEQGREINPSAQVLVRIAKTLRLSPDEAIYLFELAGQTAPRDPAAEIDTVSPTLQRMLDGMHGSPAYILNRRWDRIASNGAYRALIGNFAARPGEQDNIVRRVFTDPALKRYVGNWEDIARKLLSEFRASCARFPDDPAIKALIEEMLQASAEFREWWPRSEVMAQRTKRSTLIHQTAGAIEFEVNCLQVLDSPGLTLRIYTVLQENDSPRKLRQAIDQFERSRARRGARPDGSAENSGL